MTSTLAGGARPGLDVGGRTGGLGHRCSLTASSSLRPSRRWRGSREEGGSAASGEGYRVHGDLSDAAGRSGRGDAELIPWNAIREEAHPPFCLENLF